MSQTAGESPGGSSAPSYEELAAALAEVRAVLARRDAALVEAHSMIAALQAEVAELRARLEVDSSNSSLPPSAEGLRKKPVQPRRPGGRRGKRPGAPGSHLAMVADPDTVVEHVPAVCGGCGGGLDAARVVGTARRQVFDVPPVRVAVVEHRVQRRRCGGCGSVTAGVFPAAARAPACYGPGVRALIAYLGVHQHLPVDRCAQLLSDVLGVPVATGTVAAVVAEAAQVLSPAVEAIRERLIAAPVVHFDETAGRVAGRLHWLHTASTDTLTLVAAHPKRGVEAMDAAGVLPQFQGVAVHDGWAPYRRYDVEHALCNAHHLRELTAAAEQGHDWAGHLAELLRAANRWVTDAKAAGRDALDPALLAAIHARYDGHLTQAAAAHPPRPGPRGKPAALAARLDRHRDDVLRFTADFRVPFDNNQAERDIRPVKLQQKISGCWRTLPGAQAFCTSRSYISTARKNGQHVLDALRQAFTGTPWLPAT